MFRPELRGKEDRHRLRRCRVRDCVQNASRRPCSARQGSPPKEDAAALVLVAWSGRPRRGRARSIVRPRPGLRPSRRRSGAVADLGDGPNLMARAAEQGPVIQRFASDLRPWHMSAPCALRRSLHLDVDAVAPTCRTKKLTVESLVARSSAPRWRAVRAPSWGYKGEDLGARQYRIACDRCKKELFPRPACFVPSRTESPARRRRSAFPLPRACARCGASSSPPGGRAGARGL